MKMKEIGFKEYLDDGTLNEDFYKKYKVKPGYFFYEALIEADKIIPLKFLRNINIPDFMLSTD